MELHFVTVRQVDGKKVTRLVWANSCAQALALRLFPNELPLSLGAVRTLGFFRRNWLMLKEWIGRDSMEGY